MAAAIFCFSHSNQAAALQCKEPGLSIRSDRLLGCDDKVMLSSQIIAEIRDHRHLPANRPLRSAHAAVHQQLWISLLLKFPSQPLKINLTINHFYCTLHPTTCL